MASDDIPLQVVRKYDDTPNGKLDVIEFASLVRDLELGTIRQYEPRRSTTGAPWTGASEML